FAAHPTGSASDHEHGVGTSPRTKTKRRGSFLTAHSDRRDRAALLLVRFWHKADLASYLPVCPLLGAKRTSDEAAACFCPTLMTQSRHSRIDSSAEVLSRLLGSLAMPISNMLQCSLLSATPCPREGQRRESNSDCLGDHRCAGGVRNCRTRAG